MPAAIPGPPPFATATVAGLLSAVAQNIGGDKTFFGKVINSNPLGLMSYTTGTLPAAAGNTGCLVYNSTTSKVMYSTGSGWVALDISSGSFVLNTGDTMTGQLTITGAGLLVDSADNTLFVDATGNKVGIGTITPADKLDIATGGLAVRGATSASGAGAFISHTGSTTTISSVNWTGPAYRDLILADQTLSLRTGTSSVTERVLIGATGNVAFDTNTLFVDAVNNRVGILTTVPTQALEVGGVIYSTTGGVKLPDNTTQTSAGVHRIGDIMTGTLVVTGAGIDVNSADHTLFVDSVNSRVGVGTNTPSKKLHVKSSVVDHLVQIENTNVSGSSSIACYSNAGNEKLRIGYANSSFGAPLQGSNFIATDGTTDLIIAHASTEYHRFFQTGSVKFDQADNLLVIDSANNRIGIGLATPSATHQVTMAGNTSTVNSHVLKIYNSSTNGYSGIEFFHANGSTTEGSLSYGGGTTTAGGNGQFTLDIPTSFYIRNGTTIHHQFSSSGSVVLDTTDNLFYMDATNNKVGINLGTGSLVTAAGAYSYPLVVELGSTGTRASLIRGLGTNRKALAIQDSTNNRTWSWDHATSSNNNRFELYYHNGTTEGRHLVLTTDGKLGVGEITPTVELDVIGSGQFTGGLVVDTNTLVVDAIANQVGIGTTPGAGNKLDVAGDINLTGALKPNGLAGTLGQVLQSAGSGAPPTWVAPGTATMAIGSAVSSGTTGSILFVGTGPVLAQDNANLFWDATNSRLGIDTAVPSEALHVTGNVRFSGALMPNNTAGTSGQILTSAGAGAPPTWTTTTTITGTGTAGNVAYWSGTSVLAADAGQLQWDATNNRLGIGPVGLPVPYTLTVSGDTNLQGALYVGVAPGAGTTGQVLTSAGPGATPTWGTAPVTGAGTNSQFAIWSSANVLHSAGSLLWWNDVDGRLGINTSGGTRELEVIGRGYFQMGGTSILKPAFQVERPTGTAVGYANLHLGGSVSGGSQSHYGIAFGYSTNSGTVYAPAEIGFAQNTDGGGTKGDLYFATRSVTTDTTAPTKRMLIKDGGDVTINTNTFVADATNSRVGIATTTPSEALHVTGNVRFSGALMPNNAAGTSGQVLVSAGTGAAPTWGTSPAGGPPSFGELYEDNDPTGSSITITTAGTYYQWVTTTVGESAGSGLVVASATTDDLTVGASGAGKYLVVWSATISANTNATVHGAAHVGGSISSKSKSGVHGGNAGDRTHLGGSCIATLAASDAVDLRFTSDTNGDVVVVYHANLSIHRIA